MAARRFAILSGPSCVGKGPLIAALARFHPDVRYAQIPVMKSKESRLKGPRPDEVAIWDSADWFRPKEEIRALDGDPRYLVGDCRGLPQAVDLGKVQDSDAELLLIEIYHTLGARLVESAFLTGVEVVTVFVAPIGQQEIEDLRSAGVNLGDYLTLLMLHKQLVRARYHGKPVDDALINDARGRAEDALSELRSAGKYSHVIANRDGEGSPNWRRLPGGLFTAEPEGDAGRAVSALLHILGGSKLAEVENWNRLSL
jgi:guanylate kinase